MTRPQISASNRKTVLVVHSAPSVLALTNAVLAESHRVLLAADVESAVRLMRLPELPLDLVLIERTLAKRDRRELGNQMAAYRPDAGTAYLSGVIEDGVVKLSLPAVTRQHRGIARNSRPHRQSSKPKLVLTAGMSF